MTGTASWEQLTFLSGIIVAVGIAAFIASWRIQVHFTSERTVAQTRVDLIFTALESRIRAIENFNAGTQIVLEHVEDFRREVQSQYERLRNERREDMEGIHRRLDAVHNLSRLIDPPDRKD